MVLSSVKRNGAHWVGRSVVLFILACVSLCLPIVGANAATTVIPNTNVNVDPSTTTHYSSCVAINPANPRNVVCFSALSNANGGLSRGISIDGGASWTHSVIATGTDFPIAGGSPACAWDAFGNLFLVYRDSTGNNIEVLWSFDGGRTFALAKTFSGVGLGQPKVGVGSDSTFTPSGGSVWVAYYDTTNKSIFTSGAAVGSLGQLAAFSVPQGIAGTTNAIVGDVDVGFGNSVVVSYQVGTNIFASSDLDGLGPATFGAGILVTTTTITPPKLIPAQNNAGINATCSLAYDKSNGANAGRVYIAYTDAATAVSKDTNIFVVSSDDDGQTWSAPVQVNDDTATQTTSGTNSQFLPHIAVDAFTGNVGVAFYDCRNDLGNHGVGDTDGAVNDDTMVYASVSLDGGATFQPNVRLSAGTSNAAKSNAVSASAVDFGRHTGLAYLNGALIATWSDNSNSTQDNPSGPLANLNLYSNVVNVLNTPVIAPSTKNLPDLVVSAIFLPTGVVAGHSFTFTATITNNNVGDSQPFYVSAFSAPVYVGYLDKTQSDFTNPDSTTSKRVDTVYVPGLAGGTSIDVLLTMEYDYTGIQTVAVLVDSQTNVSESNELNNLLTQRLYVLSLGRDIGVIATVDSATGIAYTAMTSFVPSATIAAGVAGASQTGSTATITTTAPHTYTVGTQIQISGVSVAAYNGTYTISTVPTPTTFTYTIPNTPVYPIVASPNGASEVGTTATIVTAAPHSFLAGDKVFISGVAAAGYNGTFTISSVLNTTTFSYTAPAGLLKSGGGTAAYVLANSGNGTASKIPGKDARFNVTLSNLGNQQTGPFKLGVYFNRATAPTLTDTPDLVLPLATNTTLTAPTGAAATTTLTVAALPAAIQSGTPIVLTSGATTQTVYANGTAAAGATTITVQSFKPTVNFPAGATATVANYNLPVGDTVASGGILPITIDLPTQPIQRSGRAWVFADYLNTVAETVETNNIASATWGVPNDSPVIVSPVIASLAGAVIAPAPTGATETGDIVTITTTTPHNFRLNRLITIAGVGAAGYNGTFSVVSVPTPTSFTFPFTPGLVASGGGTATPNSFEAGDTITFTVGAADPNNDTIFYTWDFGDGSGPTPGGSTITHVFPGPGVYGVTCAVSDGPYTSVTSQLNIPILSNLDTSVDLGFVIVKSGYVKLKIPLPFGTKRISLASTSQVDAVVTATTTTPHNFVVGQPVSIARAAVKGYNGKFVVQSVPSSTTFTYSTSPGLAASTGGTVTPAKLNATTTIIQGTPGVKVTLKNQLLSGTPGGPGVYTFTVEYFVPKYHIDFTIRYRYTVLLN